MTVREAKGNGDHFAVYIENGVLKARFQTDTDEVTLQTGGIAAGADYDVHVTFGDGDVRLWLNGQVVAESDFDATWATNEEYLQIGANGWASRSGEAGFYQVFNGTMSDVVIADGALTPGQLNALLSEDAPQQDPVGSPIGQAGNVTVTQSSANAWHSVSFDAPLDDAVVVMGPVGDTGGDPAVTRVRNVTDNGFEFQIDEWDYLDGVHAAATVSWIAVEAGHHVLADGREVYAGSQQISGQTSVNFGGSFADTPLVFAQYASADGATMVDRVASVGKSGFGASLWDQQANPGGAGDGALSWIAMTPGGSAGGGGVAGRTGDNVTNNDSTIQLGAALGDEFVLIADMQTRDGSDPSALRLVDKSNGSATLFIEEEQSADAETFHTTEEVAYLGLYEGLIYVDDFLA